MQKVLEKVRNEPFFKWLNKMAGDPVNHNQNLYCHYRRIKEDQLQGKGKAKVIPQEMKDSRSDRIQNNRPRRDFVGQSGSANAQAINVVFRSQCKRS